MEIHKKTLVPITKQLRTSQTPWEDKLWYHLRGHRFFGLKFKRQLMVGEYVVDFCCNEKKLIIELDGGQHNETENLFRDQKRDEYFNKYGYSVLRFWNNEIEENIEGVLEKIRTILLSGSSTSPRLPSPEAQANGGQALPSPGLERV